MSTEERPEQPEGRAAGEAQQGQAGADDLPAQPTNREEGIGGGERGERMRILSLVAAGKLSPNEAAEVLAALDFTTNAESGPAEVPHPVPGAARSAAPAPPGSPVPPAPPASPTPPGARVPAPVRLSHSGVKAQLNLVLQVVDGETRINARLPLSLARAADRFLPRRIRQYLEGYEADLEQILDVVDSMGDLTAETEGPMVEIRDGETRISISVA